MMKVWYSSTAFAPLNKLSMYTCSFITQSYLYHSFPIYAEKLPNARGQISYHADANGNPELSPVSVSDEDAEIGGARPSHVGEDGVDGDDPESKRR